ncbi:hypothetical protein NSU_2385 [Novosphingobium pentaromativorans US6-1]|uniref:Uncharacterized protein n=2 Tax=Novosphingobium pentaromativorans TaxID=205844 RepID=G6EDG4_9SPHN|nr:hypothetical protein NSU_2385 [Novosphingobium pentaromativorans US6-1]
MTDYIRDQRLLDPDEVDQIIAGAPVDLVEFQTAAAAVPLEDRQPMRDWIERFNAGIVHVPA